jgi:hypothetical protein
MCGGFLIWKETKSSAHFMGGPKCLPTTKASNTLFTNFLSYIAFPQAHKWVTLQHNEPLQA